MAATGDSYSDAITGSTQVIAIDEGRLEVERERLVRQCYRLTGNLDAAEDLAQETLYEAMRNAHKLHDPSGLGPWLFAIAQNVCRRWNAGRGREMPPLAEGWDAPDDYDLEIELDRKELITLLDRALALLPAESREVLIERYVRESPHAEIGRKLGLSEHAVTKRVERGKLRLKTLLSTRLIHDAVSHGLVDHLFDEWETTDIWCPACGVRRLLGRISGGSLWLICKPCRYLPVSQYAELQVPSGVRGAAAIQAHASAEHWRMFRAGIEGVTPACWTCGHGTPLRIDTDPYDGTHYARWSCPRCRTGGWQFASPFQLLASPRGMAFWAEHQRIRILFPEREVEAEGVPAIVVGVESAATGQRLEAVLARDTLAILAIR